MQLRLTKGFPYPFPSGLTQEQEDLIAYDADNIFLILDDVTLFEWVHTVTIEFASPEAFQKAQLQTGWKTWCANVLEAPTSAEDGYNHPAIISGDRAYCGFLLFADPQP